VAYENIRCAGACLCVCLRAVILGSSYARRLYKHLLLLPENGKKKGSRASASVTACSGAARRRFYALIWTTLCGQRDALINAGGRHQCGAALSCWRGWRAFGIGVASMKRVLQHRQKRRSLICIRRKTRAVITAHRTSLRSSDERVGGNLETNIGWHATAGIQRAYRFGILAIASGGALQQTTLAATPPPCGTAAAAKRTRAASCTHSRLNIAHLCGALVLRNADS